MGSNTNYMVNMTIYALDCVAYFPILVAAVFNSWDILIRQKKYKNYTLSMFYLTTFIVILSRYASWITGIIDTKSNSFKVRPEVYNTPYAIGTMAKLVMGLF